LKTKDSDLEQKVSAGVQEHAQQLEKVKSELLETNHKYDDLQAHLQSQIDEIAKQKDVELEQLHVRVKNTIKKKDELIESLRDKLQTAEIRIKQTEILLEKQRNELLGS